MLIFFLMMGSSIGAQDCDWIHDSSENWNIRFKPPTWTTSHRV